MLINRGWRDRSCLWGCTVRPGTPNPGANSPFFSPSAPFFVQKSSFFPPKSPPDPQTPPAFGRSTPDPVLTKLFLFRSVTPSASCWRPPPGEGRETPVSGKTTKIKKNTKNLLNHPKTGHAPARRSYPDPAAPAASACARWRETDRALRREQNQRNKK